MLSTAWKRGLVAAIGLIFSALFISVFFDDKSGTLTVEPTDPGAGRQLKGQHEAAVHFDNNLIPGSSNPPPAKGNIDALLIKAEITEAKSRAEILFREWEQTNTKNLSHLNALSGNQDTNSNFLLPKLEPDIIRDIAKQSTVGLSSFEEEIAQYLELIAGRPLHTFRYLNLMVGESSSLDNITYADIKDEQSFVVDPVSGKIKIISDSLIAGKLDESGRERYKHLFQISE